MRRVSVVGNQLATSWEDAETQLLSLQDVDSVCFRVDDETCLIVLYIAAYGYYVVGSGEGELDYYALVERDLGDEPVTAFDGGNTNVYSRYVFVSLAAMLQALRTYYFTGTRDASCDWIDDRNTRYE
jgi:hypothetical protein